MPAAAPVWRFVIQPRWPAWHLFAVVAVWAMPAPGGRQRHRALSGNELSWAYTLDWPLFAGFGNVFWARKVRDELRTRRGADAAAGKTLGVPAAEPGPVLPGGTGTGPVDRPAGDAGDAKIASYHAYLAKLTAEVQGHDTWPRQQEGPRCERPLCATG